MRMTGDDPPATVAALFVFQYIVELGLDLCSSPLLSEVSFAPLQELRYKVVQNL